MSVQEANLSFFPCIEDDGAIRRHLNPCQNILATVGREMLRMNSTDNGAGRLQGYHQLWQGRDEVPGFALREWLTTSLEILLQENAAALAFSWLLSSLLPSRRVDKPTSEEEEVHKRDREGESAGKNPPKRQSKKWVVWTAPHQRKDHVHYLTLTLFHPHPLTASSPLLRALYTDKPHQSIHEEDLKKMDLVVFLYRVHIWNHSSAVWSPSPPSGNQNSAFLKAQRETMESLKTIIRERNREPVGVKADPVEPVLCGMMEGDTLVQGYVRWRVLTELCLVRLACHPRCTTTWRALVDILSSRLSDITEAASTLLHDVVRYINEWLLPYLELRDRHIGNLTFSFHTLFSQCETHVLNGFMGGEKDAEAVWRALYQWCGFQREEDLSSCFPPATESDTNDDDDAPQEVSLLIDHVTQKRKWIRFIETYWLRSPPEAFDHRKLVERGKDEPTA